MSEVIENKKSFTERLRQWVKGVNKSDSEKYIMEEVEKILEERRKSSPIIDPETEKCFKVEMTKALREAMADVETERKLNKEETEKENEVNPETKKEQIEEEKKKSVSENQGVRDINSKNIGYLDRVEMLHAMKMKLYREGLRCGDQVLQDKDVYKMLLIQKSIEKDREKYLSGLDEKSKAELVKVEEKYKAKELEFERKQNLKYRQDLYKFGELNKELRDINQYIEERQEEMRMGKINPDEYRKDLQQKESEYATVMLAIQDLNPKGLQEIADKKEKHNRLERQVLGRDYRERVYLRSSDEFKKKLEYNNFKNKEQAYTILSENKFLQKEGIERTIRESELHRKELEKELKKIEEKEPTTENIKRKAEVLKELHIVDTKIDSYNEQKESIEKDDEIAASATVENEEQKAQEEIAKIEKDFAPIEEMVEKSEGLEEQNKKGVLDKAGEEVANEIIKEKAKETGVVVGATVGIATDNAVAGVVTGAIAEKHKENSLRNEWEGNVNTEYDEKAVKEKIERDAAIAKELEEQQQVYERERTRKD